MDRREIEGAAREPVHMILIALDNGRLTTVEMLLLGSLNGR
jgi:hypothetical protein